jgi:hypothetical protein
MILLVKPFFSSSFLGLRYLYAVLRTPPLKKAATFCPASRGPLLRWDLGRARATGAEVNIEKTMENHHATNGRINYTWCIYQIYIYIICIYICWMYISYIYKYADVCNGLSVYTICLHIVFIQLIYICHTIVISYICHSLYTIYILYIPLYTISLMIYCFWYRHWCSGNSQPPSVGCLPPFIGE